MKKGFAPVLLIVIVFIISITVCTGTLYYFLSKEAPRLESKQQLPPEHEISTVKENSDEIKWLSSDDRLNLPFTFMYPASIRLLDDFGEGTYYMASYSSRVSKGEPYYETCLSDPECFYLDFIWNATTEDDPENPYNSPDVKKSEVSDIQVGTTKNVDLRSRVEKHKRLNDFKVNNLSWVVSETEITGDDSSMFKNSKNYYLEINKELYTIKLSSNSKQTIEKNAKMIEQIVSSVQLKNQ